MSATRSILILILVLPLQPGYIRVHFTNQIFWLYRKWQIKVTQYECGNLMAPEENCLQYHTARYGTFASFNWDTSASSVATSQVHLSDQQYNICIRRARSYCSICFSPVIASTTAASSYGLSSGGNTGPAPKSALGSYCSGTTTLSSTAANQAGDGDYLEIVSLQPGTGTSGTVTTSRICGSIFNGNPTTQTAQATACSFAQPFKIGVKMDSDEAVIDSAANPNLDKPENAPTVSGSGYGYSGFNLIYWQNSC